MDKDSKKALYIAVEQTIKISEMITYHLYAINMLQVLWEYAIPRCDYKNLQGILSLYMVW